MHRRIIRWSLLSAVIIGGAIGFAAYRHHHRYKHFAVHDDGMIYRCAWLEPEVIEELIEKHQIRTVVNLCGPGEMGEQRWIDERRTVKNAGARLVEIPMSHDVDAMDHPSVQRTVELLADPNSYPILVHCQHGITRTAKFLAIYDIVFRGMTAKQSIAAQPAFSHGKYTVHVTAFARNFEHRWQKHYPTASAESLSTLRQ